jgi:tetratricopeptide (TPR) repeat protein
METLDGAMAARAHARIARAEKKPDAAFAALKKGAAAHPDDLELVIEAAFAAQEVKRWDESFALLEGAVARKADAWLAWFQLGRASAVSGQKLERGAEALNKYLAEAPKDMRIPRDAAHNRLGQIYEKMSDKAKAKEQFAAALKINPDNKDAAAGLARVGAVS